MVSFDEGLRPGADNESIDFGSMIAAVRKHAWKIAAFTAFTTTVALWNVLTTIPTFISQGSMFLGDAQSPTVANVPASAANGIGFLSAFTSASDVQTSVELIQAHELIEQAILATGLNSPVLPENSGNLPYWKWKLFYHNSVDAFAPQPGDITALYASFSEPNSGIAKYHLIIGKDGNYQITSLGGWFTQPVTILTGVLGEPASGGGLSLLVKPAIDGSIPTAGSHFDLQVSSAQKMADDFITNGTLLVAAGGTDAQPSKNANVSFTSANPYIGTLFVNQIMDNYIATQLAWETQSASTTEKFVSDQLAKIATSLATADQNLAEYQAQTGIVDVLTNGQVATTRLSHFEDQRATLQLQQKALQELLADIESTKGNINPYLSSQTNDLTLQKLVGELADAQVQEQSMAVQYSRISPNMAVQYATVSQLREAIHSVVKNDLAQTNQALDDLNRQVQQYQDQLTHVPAQVLKITALTRSSQVLGNLYVLLQDEEQKALVSKAATIVNTKIVSPAEVPFKNSTPNAKKSVLVGFLIGLFGGIGLALTVRSFSGKFQSDEEIRRVSQSPIYGLIPTMAKLEVAKGILSSQARSQFAEAFRLLRSNLYLSRSVQKSTVIMVISATSADGKTAIAANLAKSLADDGKRVILVDADLYVGRVHDALHTDNTTGLTDWLTTGIVPKYKTIPNERFMVLPTGKLPQLPAELLNKPVMEQVIAKLREEFEFIILDSPPLPAVSDGMTLGSHADLILSVVNIGNTPRRAFAVHMQAIESLGRRHGMVINSVSHSRLGQGSVYGAEDISRIPGETMLIAFTKRIKELRDQ